MSDMRDIIADSANQITHSLDVNKDVRVDGTFDSIVLAGLGGSGHPGDLVNALGITTKPLYVHRNYDLPLEYLESMGFTDPLVITSSYSGNTEETLTAYKQAKERGLHILVSSSGGTLEDFSKQDNAPMAKIDFPGMQPRHTLFAAFTGIYAALRNSGLVKNIDVDLMAVAKTLTEKTASLEAKGKELAQQIKGRIPVYTSTDELGFATKNFKIQTNENAKYPAFWNTFPELNHNEMIGFSKLEAVNNPNKFFVLMLHDPDDHPRNTARMKVTADLYKSWGVTVADYTVEGANKLEKVFLTVTLGLWTTYHLALELGIDPVPVDGVEDFKTKLAEVAGKV